MGYREKSGETNKKKKNVTANKSTCNIFFFSLPHRFNRLPNTKESKKSPEIESVDAKYQGETQGEGGISIKF